MDKQQTQYRLTPKFKMEDAHKLLKVPKSECPDILDSSTTTTQMAKNHGPVWKDPVVPLERNLYGHPFGRDYYGKRQFEKVLLKHGWEKIPNWECLFVHREKRINLICVCG